MHFDTHSLAAADRLYRLNLINSITGIKPANLIGTVSEEGRENVAVFSSVIHLGSNPPLIGFMRRPVGDAPRDTHQNILDTGEYTINAISQSFAQQGHQTSAKYDRETSEFEAVGLASEYLPGCKAPFVKESRLKFGMRFVQEIEIPLNGTALIVGEVQSLHVEDQAVSASGYIDLQALDTVGISGLNSYYRLEKVAEFPYARA